MTIDPAELEQLQRLAADLLAYQGKCVDARSWGGPTIYPEHPINEDRAFRDGTVLQKLISSLATGEV